MIMININEIDNVIKLINDINDNKYIIITTNNKNENDFK